MTPADLSPRWVLVGTLGLALIGLGLFGPTGAVLALAGVGLFVPVTLGVARWWTRTGVDLESDRAKTEETRARTELAWAQAEVTRAALAATDEQAGDAEAAREKAMHDAVTLFLRAGDRLGFTSRALTPGTVSLPDWSRLVGHFYFNPEGEPLLTDKGGNVGTAWGRGWRLERALVRLGAGSLPLPPGDVPEVHVLVENTTQTHAKRKAGAVIVDQKG